MKLSNITILSVLFVIGKVNATDYCKGMDGNYTSFTVVRATSPNPMGLNVSFELYRTLLGGINNGNNISILTSGHRQINWDAAIVPFNMPPDFFVTNITRGQNSRSSNNQFVVSNAPNTTDNNFDTINREAAAEFQFFTPKRLFGLLGSTTIFIEFSVPGALPFATNRATVQGFGSVFVDVDQDELTMMTFYAKSGCIIAKEYVPKASQGLSFVGGYSNDPMYPIYTVEMELGNTPIDYKSRPRRPTNRPRDFVVMDDFIYSEPQRVMM